MSVTRHEVPPLSDGLYYATPVLLADCSESEESDTESDTCQTVIHTSPYSSPGCHTTSNLLPTLDTHESETYTDTQRLSVALPLSHQTFHHYYPSTLPLTHYAGGALSRSASAVLTPIPPSPLTLPSSPDSPPPPPRPPPPLHYTPSQFSSLPRNWGKMRGVET